MTYKEKSTENYKALIIAYDLYKLARDMKIVDIINKASKKLKWERISTSNKEFDLFIKENNLYSKEYFASGL